MFYEVELWCSKSIKWIIAQEKIDFLASSTLLRAIYLRDPHFFFFPAESECDFFFNYVEHWLFVTWKYPLRNTWLFYKCFRVLDTDHFWQTGHSKIVKLNSSFPLTYNCACYSENVSTGHSTHADFVCHNYSCILKISGDILICINDYA